MPGLADKVLVLSRGWRPMGVVRARKAIGLVAVSHAVIVCPQTYGTYSLHDWAGLPARGNVPRIQAVRFSFDRPEVIVLYRTNRRAHLPIRFSRRSVFQRDRYTCQYCLRVLRPEALTIDHVLPRSRGGRTSWENCVAACVSCNLAKGSSSPGDRVPKLRQRPRQPHWTALLENRPSWDSFLRRARCS